jgi:hypothetical protein
MKGRSSCRRRGPDAVSAASVSRASAIESATAESRAERRSFASNVWFSPIVMRLTSLISVSAVKTRRCSGVSVGWGE